MSHPFTPRLIPGVLGLVLTLQGISQGGCLHGWSHCSYCSVTTTTSTPMVLVSGVTAPPVATQHPAASLGSSSATPPPFASPTASFYAPATPYYAAPTYGATPNYATPAYSYAPASPTYGGYASGVQQSQGLPVASTSYLSGYNPSTPSAPVAPGTPLVSSHLFGSHIKQSLHNVASSIGNNKGELIQAALKIFGLASGFFPGGSDIEALVNIVESVIAERRGTKPPSDSSNEEPADGVTTKVGTAKDKANVVHIYITLTLPPGVEGKVEPEKKTKTDQQKKTDPDKTPEGDEPPVDVNKPGKMNAPAGHP